MDALDRDLIKEMLDYARTAVRLLWSADASALVADERGYLAVRHALSILGEAANQVSTRTRASLPHVPWRDAIAMRHRLVHGYRVTDPDIVVKTVRYDLPELIASLEDALKDEGR